MPDRYRPARRGDFALCIVLARFSFPLRWRDLCRHFGRSVPYCKKIFNHVVEYLVARYRELMYWYPTVNLERVREYSRIIEQESEIPQIWGFVDGTFNETCRSGGNTLIQRTMYSGHHKGHGIKFQGICTPDGMVVYVPGPYEGSMNDITMLQRSEVEKHIATVSNISRIL